MSLWSFMRRIYRFERSIEDMCFDLYKKRQARKKTSGKQKYLADNISFKDKYKGERCFIIGNGPSLNDMDLSLLKDEFTFTVNQLPKNKQFESINTTFHMWSDARFFKMDENDEGDMALLETMKNVNSKDNKPVVFYEIAAKDMVEKFELDKVLDIHYFAALQFTKKRYLKKDNIDFTKVVCNWPTVIQIAITMAIYMGFSEIYLLGLDCTGFINIAETKLKDYSQGIKYAFDVSDAEKKRMEKSNSMYSMKQELICQAELFDDYDLISEYAKRKGIKIFNATRGGLLESFERAVYEEVVIK